MQKASTSKEATPDSEVNPRPPFCLVCRKPANGFHYDVPSCNGCKMFFRRKIISGVELKCKRSSSCLDDRHPIDTSYRTCQYCRFEKCVEVGMNPLALSLSREDLSDKAKNFIEKVVKKRMAKGLLTNSPLSPTQEIQIDKVIARLGVVESKVEKVHFDGIPEGFEDLRTLEEVLTTRPLFSNTSIPSLVKKSEMRPKTLEYAHSGLLAVVEYSKTFEFTNQLDFGDKLILARHVAAMCANMTNAFFSLSHYHSDRMMLPDGTEAGENMPELDLFSSTKTGILHKTLHVLLRNKIDRVEYLLLKAVVMCNPVLSSLSERAQHIIDAERLNYALCLHRYCQYQNGRVAGSSRYAELLAIIPSIESHVQCQKGFHACMNIILQNVELRKLLPAHGGLSNLFNDIMGS